MTTINDWIAVTPFESVGVTTTRVPGIALMTHTTQLTRLKVVFPAVLNSGATIAPDTEVYMKGEVSKQQWGDVYEIDGKKFILIPKAVLVSIHAAV